MSEEEEGEEEDEGRSSEKSREREGGNRWEKTRVGIFSKKLTNIFTNGKFQLFFFLPATVTDRPVVVEVEEGGGPALFSGSLR